MEGGFEQMKRFYHFWIYRCFLIGILIAFSSGCRINPFTINSYEISQDEGAEAEDEIDLGRFRRSLWLTGMQVGRFLRDVARSVNSLRSEKRHEMTGLLILIPVSVFLGLLGLGAFLWSLKSDQYRDLDGDASRILFDEKDPDG